MGLPDGVVFSLTPENPLEQDHNIVVGIGILPGMQVLGTIPGRIQYAPLDSSNPLDIKNISIPLSGIAGGPEDAKRALCKLVDDLWAELHADD